MIKNNEEKKEKKNFYSAGLRFSCTRCSDCCCHESGFVFLSEQDLDRLAKHLHIDPAEFIETYCRWVPAWNGPEDTERLSLKEKSNYDCIFWNQGCTQYEARPLQCRSFPFWPSILAAVDSWNATAAACPGMGQGALHDKEEILSYLKQIEPIITRKDRTWP